MYANESPTRQTPQEQIAYHITPTAWGSAPNNVELIVYDVTTPGGATDVTSSTTTGSNHTVGDAITTKFIGALTLGNDYRADLSFTDSAGNRHEVSWKILCRVS